MHKPEAIVTVAGEAGAAFWYDWANTIAQQSTRLLFKTVSEFQLDGNIFETRHPNIYWAFKSGGQAFVFKRLFDENEKAASIAICGAGSPGELFCEICIENALVPVTYRLIREPGMRPKSSFGGIFMPRYTRSLALGEVKLTKEVWIACCHRMITAVNFLHSKNYVHMDITHANIFVDSNGVWHLGDYGCSVEKGSAIIGYTASYLPTFPILIHLPADWCYDWHMLCVVLAVEAERFLLAAVQITGDNVEAYVEACRDDEIKGLMELVLRANKQFLV